MIETPLFNKAWQEARMRIFSLQALPEYNSPEEKVLFEKWKDGDKEFAEYQEWFKLLEKASKKGLAIHKVRVVSIPLQEYTKYEIDLFKVSRNYGEQTMFLEKEKYQKIIQELGLKQQEDFWIFDDKLVIIFHYNEKGGLAEEELVTDKSLVEKYVELKRALLENSFSMTSFFYKMKHLGGPK